jgi:hypothetical protein
MEVVWCHFLDLNSAGRNSLSSASRLLSAFRRFWRGIPRLPLDFWYERRLYYLRADCYRQWDEAKDHLGNLREVSIAVNGTTGKVLHEIVTDGLIFFGTVAQPGDVEETPQFATAVATLWRWSGDTMSRPSFRFLFCGAIIYATKCPAEARVQDTDGIDAQSIGRLFFRNFVLCA